MALSLNLSVPITFDISLYSSAFFSGYTAPTWRHISALFDFRDPRRQLGRFIFGDAYTKRKHGIASSKAYKARRRDTGLLEGATLTGCGREASFMEGVREPFSDMDMVERKLEEQSHGRVWHGGSR